MISVIIPAYNCEKYIEKAVHSVFAQTYSDIELVVVNDGSSDKTREVLTKLKTDYSNKQFQVIDTENRGVSAARNTGLSRANGEYVAFLDSDDWLEPTAISQLYALVLKHPDFLVSTNLNFVEEDGSVPFNMQNRTEKLSPDLLSMQEALYKATGMDYHLQTACSKLFSVTKIRKYKLCFDEDIAFGEDGLFVFKYILNTKGVAYYDICLYNVLRRATSATRLGFNPEWLNMVAIDRMIGLTQDKELISILKETRIERLYADIRRYYSGECNSMYYAKVKKCLRDNFSENIKSSISIKSKIVWIGMMILPRELMMKIACNFK